MQSDDTKAATVTATGTLVATNNGRVLGVYARSAGTAGTVVLKDGGSGGTTILSLNTPAAVGGHYHQIPGGGLSFGTDLHATLTTADACTVYYALDR